MLNKLKDKGIIFRLLRVSVVRYKISVVFILSITTSPQGEKLLAKNNDSTVFFWTTVTRIGLKTIYSFILILMDRVMGPLLLLVSPCFRENIIVT